MDLMDDEYTEQEFDAMFKVFNKNTNLISKSEMGPFIRKIAKDSFGIWY